MFIFREILLYSKKLLYSGKNSFMLTFREIQYIHRKPQMFNFQII